MHILLIIRRTYEYSGIDHKYHNLLQSGSYMKDIETS